MLMYFSSFGFHTSVSLFCLLFSGPRANVRSIQIVFFNAYNRCTHVLVPIFYHVFLFHLCKTAMLSKPTTFLSLCIELNFTDTQLFFSFVYNISSFMSPYYCLTRLPVLFYVLCLPTHLSSRFN